MELHPKGPHGVFSTVSPLQVTRLESAQSAPRPSGVKLKPSLQRESCPSSQVYEPTSHVWHAPVLAMQPSGQVVTCPNELPSAAQVRLAPASDRVVPLDHNSADYLAATEALERVIELVRENNHYRESEPEDQERRLAELEAGRRLLGSRWVSVATVQAAVVSVLTYLALKFVDVPIGQAASVAWKALAGLVGIPVPS